jgi:primase-like protein
MCSTTVFGKTPSETADFLHLLFGQCPLDLYVLIWQLTGKKSTWFRVAELSRAAEFAASRRGDTYAGVALSPEDFGPGNRCEADRAAGIVGLWADIDIKHDAHKTAALPATVEDALWLANSLEIAPTISVGSGHGLQPYWLFDRPWIFAGDDERQQARQLVERFQTALRRNAKRAGWHLDSTQDLARVLRVPGSMNCKREPVPVRLIDKDGPRYDRRQLAARFPPREPKRSAPRTDAAPQDDVALALSALAALNPRRADPYMDADGGWIEVGMALHSLDSSGIMCSAWDQWSRQSDRYEEGACAEKWTTFSAGGGIGVGSLIHWAEEDGWINPRKRKNAPSDAAAAIAVLAQFALVLLDIILSQPHLLRAWQQGLGIDEGDNPCV